MKRRFPGELEPAAGAGESTPARPVQGSVLPLAKRAAGNVRAAAERAAIAEAAAAEAEAADAAVSVVIQLQEMSADAPAGPTLSVPLNITPAQLEAVVNELLEADEPTPYSFYLNEAEVLQSLKACMTAQGASTEEVQVIKYQPLAVFRVMPVSRCTDSMPGHTGAILHVSFSPDGRMCASGGGDATVRFWDVSTCMPRHTCVGHKNHVLCTAWSPDGRRFASADRNGEVRVWDPETGKEVCKPFTAHTSWVTSLAWEPLHRAGDNPGQQCELLASSSKDKTVRVWNTRTSTCQFSLSGHSDSIECVRWGGEGFIYTASRDRTILVWALEADKTRAKCIRTLSGHGHRINSLALNTDHLCRTGAFDHRGNVYETPAQAYEAAVKRYKAGLVTMGGRELLVSCSDDFTLFLWDPADSKKSVVRMTGHQAVVNHISFSPDGRYIASASFDKKVKLWDGRTGKFLVSLVGHVRDVYQVCWSGDSRYVASASKDSTVKVWSARLFNAEGKATKPHALHTLAGHADEVYALDWSPNGEMIASGGRDRLVKIWRN